MKTKKLTIIYWIITALFIYWMFQPTISSAFSYDYAVEYFTKHFGYPKYFLVFTGVTKLVGLIVLLIPGYARIKEWVYAGFTYDLVAAIYTIISVDGLVLSLWVQTLALALMTASYILFRLIQKKKLSKVLQLNNPLLS